MFVTFFFLVRYLSVRLEGEVKNEKMMNSSKLTKDLIINKVGNLFKMPEFGFENSSVHRNGIDLAKEKYFYTGKKKLCVYLLYQKLSCFHLLISLFRYFPEWRLRSNGRILAASHGCYIQAFRKD